MRKIDPPRDSFDQLPTPLEPGERRVIDLFDEKLPAKWEIYVQPHLNGLRPDIVLLHPDVGVAVFEIKDWDLRKYFSEKDQAGRLKLKGRKKNGTYFPAKNPIDQILLYEEELFELYCPRIDARAGRRAVITAGLVFPFSPRREVERVFSPFKKEHKGMREDLEYYPITGEEDIFSDDIAAIFPKYDRSSFPHMNHDIAKDLRGWLKEPFFSKQQQRPLALDNDQQKLATRRTNSGFRRIKGPAGCGKSVVLAVRAATLAAEGKNTLVLSFNITLCNYLRDLAVRHVRDLAVRHRVPRQVILSQIVFLHFHRWCKRVCIKAGRREEYKHVWRNSSDGVELNFENKDLVSLMKGLYREDVYGIMPKYDAILVDEGQDFYFSWWQTLRMARKKGGEMVMVADKTQDIYERATAWTEKAMRGAGFHGPWVELKTSYRLPPKIVPFVRKFAEEFLTGEEIDIPMVNQRELDLYPVELRWLHVREQSKVLETSDSELQRMMTRLHCDTAITDIIILFNSKNQGIEFVRRQEEKRGLKVLHTFDEDRQESRRQKVAFRKGRENIKATTHHSFKGWEARHLIVFVESVRSKRDRALLYTSLTRLLRHENGSSLTVVSCCSKLRAYGKSWPVYKEL